MQPHHRTPHIRQSTVQTIPVPEVDGRHADASPAIVPSVVLADSPAPQLARLGGTLVPVEADVDQEVAVVEVRDEVRRRGVVVARPLLDVGRQEGWRVPAVELAGAVGLVVEGCA